MLISALVFKDVCEQVPEYLFCIQILLPVLHNVMCKMWQRKRFMLETSHIQNYYQNKRFSFINTAYITQPFIST